MIRDLTIPVMKILLLLCILIGTVLVSTNASAMTDIKGQPSSVASHVGKGQWLIVEAWHSKCSICMKGMPAMVQAHPSFPNAKLIGVSLDGNRHIAQRVVRRFNINFPTIVSNTSEFDQYLRKVANRPLRGAPTYLIFSPTGKLKAVQSGKLTPRDIKGYLNGQQ
jgi:thiol-disulfide isomerase/thioredoxin